MMTKNPQLRKALALAAQGKRVVPCGPDGQALTHNGAGDASSDEGDIRAWWTVWPDAKVGTID